jgi:hypothetical protein
MAYGESTLTLPRAGAESVGLSVSTTIAPPPTPEPVYVPEMPVPSMPPITESPNIHHDPTIESPAIEPPIAYEPEVEVPIEDPTVEQTVIDQPHQEPEESSLPDPVVIDQTQEDIDEAPIHIDPVDFINEVPIIIDFPSLGFIRWPPISAIDTIATLCCYESGENLYEILGKDGHAIAWDGIQQGTSAWHLRNVMLNSYGMADATDGMVFTRSMTFTMGTESLVVPEPCGTAFLVTAAIYGMFIRHR